MRFETISKLDSLGARDSFRAPLLSFSPGRAALAALAGAVLTLAGCGRFGGGSADGVVARDVLEIKHQLEERNKNAEAEQRKTEFRLQSLEEKIQTRTEILQNNLDESLRTQREQSESLKKVGQQVEDLSYQIARMGSGMGPSGGSAGAAAQTQPSPAAQGTPAITPVDGSTPAAAGQPAAGTDPTEEIYNEGLKQYNLGKYDEAGAEFDKALAMGATAERAAQINYWLAESTFRLDQLDRSEHAFRTMIEQAKALDPASPVHGFSWRAVERLAQIRQRQGDNAKALYYYKYILQTNPGYEGADRIKAQVESMESGAAAPAQPGA